jgi:hypothetical protein
MTFDDLFTARNAVREIFTSNASNGVSIFQNVYDGIDRGFSGFQDEYGNDPTLGSTSKALIVLDKIASQMRLLEAQCPADYEFRDEQNSYNLVVRSKLNCRIKKLDEYGRPRPGRTKRYEQFCDQSLLLPLKEGGVTAINLFLGHDIDHFFTTLQNVYVSCPNPGDVKKVLWRLPAYDMYNDRTPSVFPINTEEILPVITLKEHLRNGNQGQGDQRSGA